MTPAAAKLIGAGLATIALAGVGIGIGQGATLAVDQRGDLVQQLLADRGVCRRHKAHAGNTFAEHSRDASLGAGRQCA